MLSLDRLVSWVWLPLSSPIQMCALELSRQRSSKTEPDQPASLACHIFASVVVRVQNIAALRERVIGRGTAHMSVVWKSPGWGECAALIKRMMDGFGMKIVKAFDRTLSQKQNQKRDESIEKPRLDLLEENEARAKRPSMWNVVFYNDDYTSMEFVAYVLTRVFHRSTEDALALTFAVHTQGKGIAGTYTFEVAEQKQCEVLLMAKVEEHPLRVEVERA